MQVIMMLCFYIVLLFPKSETQELNLTVSTNPTVTKFNLSGAIPSDRIVVVVEGRDEISVSGEISTPQTASTGEVVFTNLTIQPITIPQRTLVRTLDSPPIRFATTTSVVLPAQAGVQRTSQTLQ